MLVPVVALCAVYSMPLAMAVCVLAWRGSRQAECTEWCGQ